jgi:hypothetical protein
VPCSPRPKATDQHMPRHKPTVKHDTAATQNTRAPKSKLSGILQGPNMLPQCLAAKDEVEVYAFEGSPNECCDGCAVCLQRLVGRCLRYHWSLRSGCGLFCGHPGSLFPFGYNLGVLLAIFYSVDIIPFLFMFIHFFIYHISLLKFLYL